MTLKKHNLIALALCALPLAACDPLGLNDAARIAATREAEGKAVGGACRHSGRALEKCYGLNPKMAKAAIFAGWRDMDAYMRENNIQIVSPEGSQPPDAAQEAPKAAEAKPIEGAAPEAPAPKNAAAPAEGAEQRPNGRTGDKRPNRVA